MKKRRIIMNNDFDNILSVPTPITDDDIYAAADKIAGTQVDTLFLRMPVAGISPDDGVLDNDLVHLYEHPEAVPWRANYDKLRDAGKDPFKMVLERAHKNGIECFGSLRMNDNHRLNLPFHPWVWQFYYNNLHNRLNPDAKDTRIQTEFDYRKSVIRERMLEIVRKAFTDYDIDGLEMDFMRNPWFFPRNEHPEECAPVMTQFVRDVKKIVDEFSEKRGRKLYLCATSPFTLYHARKQGLDIPTWAKLGLIDMLVMSTTWYVYFNHDIYDTKLKLPGVQIYAGCDVTVHTLPPAGRSVPKEAYRAMATNYLRQGAEGVYLYNVMAWTMSKYHDPEVAEERFILNEIGELETLENKDKLYLYAPDINFMPDPYKRSPITIPADGSVTVRLSVGDDVKKAANEGRLEKIYLQTVSSDCDDYENYAVYLNFIDVARQYLRKPRTVIPESRLIFPEPGWKGELPAPENVRRHPVRPIDLHLGTNFITIESKRNPLTITDIEVAIIYKK